jgi:hypothetical protein
MYAKRPAMVKHMKPCSDLHSKYGSVCDLRYHQAAQTSYQCSLSLSLSLSKSADNAFYTGRHQQLAHNLTLHATIHKRLESLV